MFVYASKGPCSLITGMNLRERTECTARTTMKPFHCWKSTRRMRRSRSIFRTPWQILRACTTNGAAPIISTWAPSSSSPYRE
ncbi:hypothetical protein U0070_007583 [Myodes glareolus]|uniref:Uncharacterized protein n=1 Tax=Myodes glareolus TaxID=447135 RepID=A0AAW0H0P9_MYOGA